MSITKTYRCDLCHDMQDPDKDNVQGIYWVGNTPEFKPAKTVEHHLCWACAIGIKNSVQAILTGTTP